MANVLTDLAADAYKAADIIGRELVGFIPSVRINADGTERLAKGQVARSHFTRAATAGNITPAMTIPEGTDQTVDNKTISISKERSVQIPWTGEDIKYANQGSGFETIYGDQIKQAMRTLTNEIEVDLASEIYKNAGNAYGTSGTTPFASNFNDLAEVRKLLIDRGMPENDGLVTGVYNTAAGVKLRNLAQLQKANESGSTELLRQGVLLDLQGIRLKESGGVQSHTKGTGTGYLVNNGAGYSAGDTEIAVDTGSGTIVAGDIIVWGSSANNGEKSVVKTGVSGAGTITLAAPLVGAVADGVTLTIQNNFTANVILHRDSAELVLRAPAVPQGGDAADDAMIIQDPHSGIVFELRSYKGYRKAMFEVAAVWGQKAWKGDFIAIHQG